jgi:regulator of sigma E protease
MDVRRGDTQISLTLPAPQKGQEAGEKKTPDLGVSWGQLTLTHPSPVEQVADAVLTIANMLDALFSPKSDVKAQHFSGPVGILKAYYSLFDSEQGWRLALAFSVFFNVNLALFNLLPFPVLDGGHITLALIESIRRKPIGGKFLEGVQTACAIAVMVFLAYVTFFDVSDFFSGKKSLPSKGAGVEPPKASESPKTSTVPEGAKPQP